MRFTMLLLLILAAPVEAEPLLLRGRTMGTTYQIRLHTAGNLIDTDELQSEVDQLLAEIDRQMSTYRSDSELSRFNQQPAGEWFPVSPPICEVAQTAQQISRQSNGALDVTVNPLVRLWHFGPSKTATDAKRDFEPPTADKIAKTLTNVGYTNLEVQAEPPALRKRIDGIEVDLSSIAPGYAVDQLVEISKRRGIQNFMVEIGGEVRAGGLRPDGTPWRVAIERPSIAGRPELQSVIMLEDAAVATAGGYRNFFEFEGRRYSHVIDPASGRPVEHDLSSVTVVADTCIMADGWDTPLLVLGPQRGYDCAERHDIAAQFNTFRNGKHEVRETSAWKARFGGSRP